MTIDIQDPEPSWNVKITDSGSTDWPLWATTRQQQLWKEGVLVIWDHESQTVIALNLQHTLTLRDFLLITSDWRTLGLRIGNVAFNLLPKGAERQPPPVQTIPEPVFTLFHGSNPGRARSFLTNAMVITPVQAQQVFEAIEANDVMLLRANDAFWEQLTPRLARVHAQILRKGQVPPNQGEPQAPEQHQLTRIPDVERLSSARKKRRSDS